MRFWTCTRCGTRSQRIKQKCPGCGKARPKRATAAQKALTETYEQWVDRFGGTCGICGREPSGRRRLDREHCHKTGKPRGVLCARCNRALPSWVTPEWLENAATYLRQSEERVA